MQSKLSNPSIFLLLAFGFGLVVLGVFQLIPTNAAYVGAVTYATLVAAIGEFVGGFWAFARGDTYLGAIGTTFGAWLIGFFLMFTQGATMGILTEQSEGLYSLALVIPVILLAIPSIKFKLHVFTGAFVFLTLLVLFLGLAGMGVAGAATWGKLAGASSLLAALLLWYSAYGAIKGLISEMAAPASN